MPPPGQLQKQIVVLRGADLGVYPLAAYQFVQHGLAYTVHQIYGPPKDPKTPRHVSGRQLCHGLRELAVRQWGFLAQTVLRRWNITSTLDFGHIVFCLARQRIMSIAPWDNIDDFRNVYDFAAAFESAYRIA